MLKDGRVQLAVPAIYSENGELDAAVKANIDLVAARDLLQAQMPSVKLAEVGSKGAPAKLKRELKTQPEGVPELAAHAPGSNSTPP